MREKTYIYKAIGITGDVLASSSTMFGLEYWMNQGMNQGKPYRVVREEI